MKKSLKSLLSLAILASFTGAAYAQSSVTAYGTLDAGLSYANTGNKLPVSAAGDKWSLESGISQPSLIGFKGVEELGVSLKAIFQLEAGLQINNGSSSDATGNGRTGSLFNRASWVGLSGDFGTVMAGRQFTPLYNALKTLDPFQLGMAGNAANLMSIGGANIVMGAPVGGNNVAFGGGGVVGQTNSLRYESQIDSGLSASFNYGFGGIQNSAQNGREIGTTLNYVNGPLSLLASYDAVNAIDNSHTFHTTLLGGIIDWSDLGLPIKTSMGYALNKGSDVVGGADVDTADVILGLRIPMGRNEILASYIHKGDKSVASMDAQQYALGYTYALSKRTALYSSIAMIVNKNAAGYTVGNATNVGTGVKVVDFGLRHSF